MCDIDRVARSGSLKNDIVYVPRNADDISLVPASDYQRLDAFIEQQSCMRNQRGRIIGRGSCRNGWLGLLNARLTKAMPVVGGQHVELTADVVNVLNLISPRWGRYRDVTASPSVTLLRLVGWDGVNERPVYRLPVKLPAPGLAEDVASRWRMQLGTRYSF